VGFVYVAIVFVNVLNVPVLRGPIQNSCVAMYLKHVIV